MKFILQNKKSRAFRNYIESKIWSERLLPYLKTKRAKSFLTFILNKKIFRDGYKHLINGGNFIIFVSLGHIIVGHPFGNGRTKMQ